MPEFVVNARFLTQPVTGVQRFAIELCKQLRMSLGEKNVVFVAPNNIINEEIADQLNVNIVGKHTGHVWEQVDLPMYLKRQGSPLLLNLCNTAPYFYKNKIVTIHDVSFEVYPQTYSKGFLWFYKLLIPSIIKNSNHVITVSRFSKEEIMKYYHTEKDKISVIYNAAGGIFRKTDFRLPTTNGRKYFAAVSSLNYRKNLPLVLNAFDTLSKEIDDIYLYIIGGVDTKSFSSLDLSKYYNNTRIIFTGRVSDDELVSYYNYATGFIYPSLYEGFGIPPLEAQQCGTAVILAEASCLPEIFGKSALYCDPENVSSLMEKMRLLIDDDELRSRFIEDGYVNSNKYSWKASGLELVKVLNKYIL